MIALLSGLIGALISAMLGYWIRDSLDKRALRRAEARLAYVHLVRVSQLVALRSAAVAYIKTYVGDRAEDLSSKDGAFEPSHKLSVLVAQALKEIEWTKAKETPALALVSSYLRAQLEAISESKLSAEDLAALPRDVTLTYSQFLGYLSRMHGTVLLWISFVEEGPGAWLTSENIHEQWVAVKRFFELAAELRTALVHNGAATPGEASTLLTIQTNACFDLIIGKLKDEPKIRAAFAEVAAKAATDAVV